MKKNIILLLFTCLQISGLTAQEWHTNFDEAKRLATEENKPIILVFQGSDWCAPCIKLERAIWSNDAFKSYAKEHYIMFKADFPRKKKNALPNSQTEVNAFLAETYNTRGIFPFVVILNGQGEVSGEMGYKKMSAEAYIEALNKFIEE